MWDFDDGMMNAFAKSWWMLGIRGLAALAFGLVAILWPGMTLGALVVFYAVYMLFDGVFAIGAAVSRQELNRAWLPLLLTGVASLLAGAVTVIRPGLTSIELLYLIAIWAILTGVITIAASFKLRQFVPDELLLMSDGILSLLFGLMLVVLTKPGIVAGLWLIASYAFAYGAALIALAFRIRRGGAHMATIQ